MPRAVPPWLHRVCIRRFGPRDPWSKLLLFAVNSFMDDTGHADPGIEAIAEAAVMGQSTVRAKLPEVSKAQWLAIYPRSGRGQQWRSYAYRPCVPDWIDLETIPKAAELADRFESSHGGIEPRAVSGARYKQTGRTRVPPARGGSPHRENNEAPPANGAKYRQPTSEAPPADGAKHRQPLGDKSSLKAFQESDLREGALTSPAGEARKPKEQNTGAPVATSLPVGKVAVARGLARSEESEPKRFSKAQAAARDFGITEPDRLAKMFHLTQERAREAVA
jgi:hypothetical protein